MSNDSTASKPKKEIKSAIQHSLAVVDRAMPTRAHRLTCQIVEHWPIDRVRTLKIVLNQYKSNETNCKRLSKPQNLKCQMHNKRHIESVHQDHINERERNYKQKTD